MITVTDRAAKKITDLGVEALRVSVKKTGCNGYAYVFKEHQLTSDEVYYTDKNVKILIAEGSEPFILGSAIDYVTGDDGFTSKFDIVSTLESGRCGCGESFNIDSTKI
jgi:iron-sulfur cluster assembly protein